MFIIVKKYEGEIDEAWGFRGPFATPEETYEEAMKLISAMCDPEHVTELTILGNPDHPYDSDHSMFGVGYSASSGWFFLTRKGEPMEGVMFRTLTEAYQHGLEDDLWKANNPPRVSWFT